MVDIHIASESNERCKTKCRKPNTNFSFALMKIQAQLLHHFPNAEGYTFSRFTWSSGYHNFGYKGYIYKFH